MSDNLISKKELLEKYGISYGALYRWKRKGLIPEEWFIKKSTVTGQETFFPRELIIERMELIKSQKDGVSLDDLSEQLNHNERKQESLIIDTVFGEKTIRFEDIKKIEFGDMSGKRIDITDHIRRLLDEGKEN